MVYKKIITPLGPVKYRIDPELDKKFQGKIMFPEKIEKAREIFKKTGFIK